MWSLPAFFLSANHATHSLDDESNVLVDPTHLSKEAIDSIKAELPRDRGMKLNHVLHLLTVAFAGNAVVPAQDYNIFNFLAGHKPPRCLYNCFCTQHLPGPQPEVSPPPVPVGLVAEIKQAIYDILPFSKFS